MKAAKKKEKENMLEEPEVNYGTSKDEKSIHFFSSLEEQEEDYLRYLAGLNPL
jgi:hypothetical protein